jgi:hypothetical protein
VTSAFSRIAEDITRDGFAFRSGKDMRPIMRMRGLDAWPAFASSWDDLGLDLYMADGGRYRRRRFAAFAASSGAVTRKPHQPHYQSRDHNPLNGGIERWFTPVSDSVSANGFTRGILGVCTTIFDAASPAGANGAPWHAEMHQFRIEAVSGQSGLPTPEGAHRDGVDWVCVLLVNRCNVSSGVTQIFDPEGRSLGEFTLTEPLDGGLSRRSARASRRYAYRSVGSWLESLTRCPGAHLSARWAGAPTCALTPSGWESFALAQRRTESVAQTVERSGKRPPLTA